MVFCHSNRKVTKTLGFYTHTNKQTVGFKFKTIKSEKKKSQEGPKKSMILKLLLKHWNTLSIAD